MKRIYLDHTATTPLDPRVFDVMKPYFIEKFGNASSIHTFGQEARAALDESRDTIAKHLGAQAGEIFFVSCGTEADNFALKGVAWQMRAKAKNHIITSKAEHHAVLDTCEFLGKNGFQITYLDVDRYGAVNPDSVRRAIMPATGLVSIMHANNEVGTLNPVAQIAAIAHEHGILFHSDAVQTFGKIPINVDEIGADLLSISAHKIYGPKGIGALFIRKGIVVERLMHGGGQERGRRAGTENVPLAVGFAKAATLLHQDRKSEADRLLALKNELRKMLEAKFPSIQFNGHPVHSLPHILNVSFNSEQMEIDGEALLFNLDMAGIAVTSGSACTSGSMEPSHVLLAMGRDPKTAKATIRFSMGHSTTSDDLQYVVDVLEKVVGRIGKVFV
ncbi:MAG: cysteine desulfurase [Ignavibacteriae bacterium]|nr:cysteine desulfurase [Ignavibacteria bacterium]MBI3364973.1 cysteine desulfurase [Ignavibacteriota bacterium]